MKVQNDLLCAADNGQISILALLDLSAAFDTIDHGIHLDRLQKSFGIGGTVLLWFGSYLYDRSQRVCVHGTYSNSLFVKFGVPQGSVLGPILYTLYTRPLGSIIGNHKVNFHMYADDTQLYVSGSTSEVQSLCTTMSSCINDVKIWMETNKLQMNDDKTEILLCNTKAGWKPADVSGVCIGAETINFSEKAKNLGVYFDSNLSMQAHINYMCQILYCELRRLAHLSPFLSENALKLLMSSFVLSRFDYCNALLAGIPDEMLKKLQRIQNHAARLILKKSKFDHVTPMLIKLHWLPIKLRIQYKLALFCYKCKNNRAPEYLSDLIQSYVPQRSLRSSNHNLLQINSSKTKTYGCRAFTFVAPTVWNNLPQSLREETESELKF